VKRLLLMTADEARSALVASSLELIRAIDCDLSRTLRLLYGTGRVTGLSSKQRQVVSAHRLLVQTLKADGLETIAHEELEGLASLLEREWVESPQTKAS
jgi:hypothetical protein